MLRRQGGINKKTPIYCAIAVLVGLLSACGGNKFQDLSNSELQEKYSFCNSGAGLSPGGAIICDNVERECKDRAKEKKRRMCY